MGLQFERCPKAMLANELAPEADLVSDALVFREHGLPPVAGGLLDQDPRFLEALAIVDREIAKLNASGADDGK